MSSEYGSSHAKKCLVPLLVVYVLGILCLQAFNLVFQKIGADVGAAEQASLITAIPGVILGIVCFVYASLSDFVPLKRMTIVGFVLLLVGSVFGFFFHDSLALVIFARSVQTAGAQIAGSVFLVVAARYLEPSEKVVFFGIFTAGYQLSTAIGVLAGGFLSTVGWSFLFLIPVLGVVFLPAIMRNLPDNTTTAGKVDVPGFLVFGLGIALLTLFFSFRNWLLLVGALVLFAAFFVYIGRAKAPFVTPDFFRNRRWLASSALVIVFYLPCYGVSPLINGIGSSLYGLDSAQVSLFLLWGNLAGALLGTLSGKIMGRIGRERTLILAGCLSTIGLSAAALLLNSGMTAIVPALMAFYAGQGLLYSPIVDTVLSTLPPEQSGRGIGMNDLVMNASESVGIAIFGGLIGTSFLSGSSVVGVTGSAANFSNLLLIFATVELVALVLYFAVRGMLAQRPSKEV